MLVPEERVAFFDVVVALVRRVVSGNVRTGYFGLRGGEGEGEVSFYFGGVDDRFMRTNRKKKRKKKRKRKRKKRMRMRTRKGMMMRM